MSDLRNIKGLYDLVEKNGILAFCETGCRSGNGLMWALDHGFGPITSCDTSSSCVKHCRRRFSAHSDVQVYQMNSVDFLAKYQILFDTPTLYWLDAHDTSEPTFPVMEELEILRKRKTFGKDMVLIDDVDAMPGGPQPWKRQVESPTFAEVQSLLEETHWVRVLSDCLTGRPILAGLPREFVA